VVSWNRLNQRFRLTQRGFTLIETLIIVVVLAVLTAVTAPSLMGVMDLVRINQTVTDVRGTLQEGQRQAIRSNQPCVVSVSYVKENGKKKKKRRKSDDSTSPSLSLTSGYAECPSLSEPEVPENVDIATNVASPTGTTDDATVTFGIYGSAEFSVVGAKAGATTAPKDPSGQIVAYIAERKNVQKKCIAISNTLGLTRVGNYTGGVTPEEITEGGICTALDWTTQ
jgi:prepilin-type N-terminal cleavage/methylation domain-containing protein